MQIIVQGQTYEVNQMETSAIIRLYNDMAFEMGETAVNRFATRGKAESRLIGMSDRYNEWLAKRPQAQKVEPEAPVVIEAVAPVEAPAVQLTDTDTQQVKAEAATRRAAPVEAGSPRWARAKYEAPAKVAYRPRAGSSQAVMYSLLTRPNGIDIHDFCEEMKQFRDKTLHQPATVWSCLRYLFVTSKGYGLNFDGQRISLIVPADERDAVRAKQETVA